LADLATVTKRHDKASKDCKAGGAKEASYRDLLEKVKLHFLTDFRLMLFFN
jgi:hypothetical protein